MWLPKQVIISASTDGKEYTTLATVDNDISPEVETLQFKTFGWEGNAKARYVRYQALSNGIEGGCSLPTKSLSDEPRVAQT